MSWYIKGFCFILIPKRFRQFSGKSLGSLDSDLYLFKTSQNKYTKSPPWLVQLVACVFSETSLHIIDFKEGLRLLTYTLGIFMTTCFPERTYLLHLVILDQIRALPLSSAMHIFIQCTLILFYTWRKMLEEPEVHAYHHLASDSQDPVESNHCAFPNTVSWDVKLRVWQNPQMWQNAFKVSISLLYLPTASKHFILSEAVVDIYLQHLLFKNALCFHLEYEKKMLLKMDAILD